MKFSKTMTKILSVLIMASMVGTSVQIPTYAEFSDAAWAIIENTTTAQENNIPDGEGSAESDETVAAGDEDNNKEGADAAQNEEAEAASNSGAENNSGAVSRNEDNSSYASESDSTSSSSSSSYSSSSSLNYDNMSAENSVETSQLLEPYSTENDSDKLWLSESFSLFEYFGMSKTFTATAADGDGNDIVWKVGDPKFVSISEPVVAGDTSTVEITWDGESVETIERTPFYAMLKSNPLEKVTGTLYLSNGIAPEGDEEKEEMAAGSKTEFESDEVRKFVEELYQSGLTQENSVYDLSMFGDTGAPDYGNMTDDEILALYEEMQNENNNDENNNETKASVTASDEDEESDNNKDEISEENDAIYNKEETQSKTDKKDTILTEEKKTKTDESNVEAADELMVDETQPESVSEKTDEARTYAKVDSNAGVTVQPETKEVVTKETVQKEVIEEVKKTQQVETTTTKTTTTEIVSEEPIVETVTQTVYEEVPTEKEMRVETVVAAAYDEETGETIYETEYETIMVPSTETVATEETVEQVVGTNYTVRETVTTDDGTQSSTTVNEYTTTSAPSVGTQVESFTTYTEQEITEYVARMADVEIERVNTVTVDSSAADPQQTNVTASSGYSGGSYGRISKDGSDSDTTISSSYSSDTDNSSDNTDVVSDGDVSTTYDPVFSEQFENDDPMFGEQFENDDPMFGEQFENDDPMFGEQFENDDPISGEQPENDDPSLGMVLPGGDGIPEEKVDSTTAGMEIGDRVAGETEEGEGVFAPEDTSGDIIEPEVQLPERPEDAPSDDDTIAEPSDSDPEAGEDEDIEQLEDGTIIGHFKDYDPKEQDDFATNLSPEDDSVYSIQAVVQDGEVSKDIKFGERFQRMAVGESFDAADVLYTVTGKTATNIKVINSKVATVSGTRVTAVAYGRTQVIGTIDDKISIIEVEVRTSASDIASPMIASGGAFTVALKKDGTVWAWGYNGTGELGDGTTATKYYPVQVVTGEQGNPYGYLQNIIQITAGSNFAAALSNTGEVYLWGSSSNYALGVNQSNVIRGNTSVPVKMNTSEIHDIKYISAGHLSMMAIRADGSLWAWGYNGYGMLGNGTTNTTATPVRVLAGNSPSTSGYIEDVIQAAPARYHSVVLKADGTVWAFGSAQFGQLGFNSTNANTGWGTVTRKDYRSLNVTYPYQAKPVQVLRGAQNTHTGTYLKDVVQISAAGGYGTQVRNYSGTYTYYYYYGTSLALTADKNVYGWGSSGYGALGGTVYQQTAPRLVNGSGQTVQAILGGASGQSISNSSYNYAGTISVGSYTHTLMLYEDGTVHSAGYNAQGQLGNGNTTTTGAIQTAQNSDALVKNMVQLSASTNGYSSASLRQDGTVWTWGYNANGQAGNGTVDTPKTTPLQAGTAGSNTLVIRGGEFASTIGDDGPMGKMGVYGDKDTVISNLILRGDDISLRKSANDLKYDAFRINKNMIFRKFSLALAVDEEIPITSGALTNVTVTYKSMNPDIVTVDAVGTITPNNQGRYGSTQIVVIAEVTDLGITHTFRGLMRVSIAPSDGIAMPQIATGAGHTVALRYDGTVWAWGYNANGELGNGGTANIYSPIQVLGGATGKQYLEDIIQIAAGSNYTLALRKDGTVWAWGYNGNGELGNGTTTTSRVPVQVQGETAGTELRNIVAITAGYYSSFALRRDGTVYAWGYNNYGQLGISTTGNKYYPTKVTGGASGSQYLEDIIQVESGRFHTAFLKSNGTVFTAGSAQFGQLGFNTAANVGYGTVVRKDYRSLTVTYPYKPAPVQVLTGAQGRASGYLEDVVQIDASGGYGTQVRNYSGTYTYYYYYGTSLA